MQRGGWENSNSYPDKKRWFVGRIFLVVTVYYAMVYDKF
jgi:hypothetical protein